MMAADKLRKEILASSICPFGWYRSGPEKPIFSPIEFLLREYCPETVQNYPTIYGSEEKGRKEGVVSVSSRAVVVLLAFSLYQCTESNTPASATQNSLQVDRSWTTLRIPPRVVIHTAIDRILDAVAISSPR